MEYPKSSEDPGIHVYNLHSIVPNPCLPLVVIPVPALQEVGVGSRVPQSEMSSFLPIPVSSFHRVSLSSRLRVCFIGSPHLPFDGYQPYIRVLISRCSGPSVQEGTSPKNR